MPEYAAFLKEAIKALAKPSGDVYRRQTAVFGRLCLKSLSQIGFLVPAAARFYDLLDASLQPGKA